MRDLFWQEVSRGIQDAFGDLEENTRKLNLAAGKATKLIRETNELLRKVGAGAEYWVAADPKSEMVIGFAKIGTWQLAASYENGQRRIALLSADRATRIVAAGQIPIFLVRYAEFLRSMEERLFS